MAPKGVLGMDVFEHNGRWIIAEYRDGRFYGRLSARDRRLTGCHTVYGSLGYIADQAPSYARKADAVRHKYQDGRRAR
jgi:hypothetical protein